jgi:hypothetical protein
MKVVVMMMIIITTSNSVSKGKGKVIPALF